MSFFEAETAQVKCKWAVSWQQKRLKTECPRYDYCEDFIIVEFSSRIKVVSCDAGKFFCINRLRLGTRYSGMLDS